MSFSINNISKLFVALALSVICTCTALAQEQKEAKEHSPRKASILSAVLPGTGQIYNKKYWKVPLVYAAIGTSVYYIGYNTSEYKSYKKALIARQDNDPNTIDLRYPEMSDDLVERRTEYFRRMRDISYIALAATYILNILDASVDAHLKEFDVKDDLSVSLGGIQQGNTLAPAITIRKRF